MFGNCRISVFKLAKDIKCRMVSGSLYGIRFLQVRTKAKNLVILACVLETEFLALLFTKSKWCRAVRPRNIGIKDPTTITGRSRLIPFSTKILRGTGIDNLRRKI